MPANSEPVKLTKTRAIALAEALGELQDDLESNNDGGDDTTIDDLISDIDQLQTQLDFTANNALPAPVIINIREDDADDDKIEELEDLDEADAQEGAA